MARAVLSTLILLASVGSSVAQTANCYPRIGAYSGQYEGSCPNSTVKWTAIENTIGAFGRNCNDEPWTYNRIEKTFYHRRANEKFPMQDCYEAKREQVTNNAVTLIDSETVRHFHEGKIAASDGAARQPIAAPQPSAAPQPQGQPSGKAN